MNWNAMLVRERLVEAADTMDHIVAGRIGPGALKSCWPVFAQEKSDAYGYTAVKTRYVPTAAHISRANEAQAWLSALVDDDRSRQIVWARAVCEARKQSFASWCKKNRIVRRSADRLLQLIYERISASLCKACINLRYPDYGRVSTHEGINGMQIDSLPEVASPRSFMTEDARPDAGLPDDPEAFERWLAKTNAERRKEQERRRRAKMQRVEDGLAA
ncbi:DUF6362 family protein [Mesorhizobium sp. BR1-1-16]|uniref:DUF6362 family protein n=1 Tax=Mesorhizobium sp. BR1-1-16 TaxID=2876653 RepID=UPI001CCA6F29|nr:DUF6362 family protein [Mesorhizobium sp. BR1-1-16]MBZ9939156.1 DUF6362 family protein [Mesorhizobium sp. BR1-1-16]